MRKFFKDNIWLFAIVAAILVIQGILGYYRKNQVAEMNRLSGKENIKNRGKTYTFVIYERGVNMEVRELK